MARNSSTNQDQPLDETQSAPAAEAVAPQSNARPSAAEVAQIREMTGALLAQQPKRKVKLRANPNPKAPNYETVQINGYTYVIQLGQEVDVPDEVYQILVRAGLY
jgi:hypothetical protein